MLVTWGVTQVMTADERRELGCQFFFFLLLNMWSYRVIFLCLSCCYTDREVQGWMQSCVVVYAGCSSASFEVWRLGKCGRSRLLQAHTQHKHRYLHIQHFVHAMGQHILRNALNQGKFKQSPAYSACQFVTLAV